MVPGWSMLMHNPHNGESTWVWLPGREHGVTLRVITGPRGITTFGPSSNVHVQAPVAADRALDAHLAIAALVHRIVDPLADKQGRSLVTECAARNYGSLTPPI